MDDAEVDIGSYRYKGNKKSYYGGGVVDDVTSSSTSFSHASSNPASESSSSRKTRRRLKPSGQQFKPGEQYGCSPPSLSWRLDPDDSLSDWTLTVVGRHDMGKKTTGSTNESNSLSSESTDDETAKTMPASGALPPPSRKYFVHRTQLAVGPRRSEFFTQLFKRQRDDASTLNEDDRDNNSSRGTRIELKPSAAAAFPAMLDFIYSPVGTPVDATTETAVALRHLATCFGIRELFNSVTNFIKEDLSTRTAPAYLMEASTFRHEKLLAATTKICAEGFESIKLSRMVTLPPELFERVVRSPDLQCDSKVLSTRVASYCRCRPGVIGSEMLQSLTNEEIMPQIAPDESLFYLNLLVSMGLQHPDRDGASGNGDGLLSLYDRCVASCHDVVRNAIEVNTSARLPPSTHAECRHKKNAAKDYNRLPSDMKVDLLEAALSTSQPTLNVSAKPVKNDNKATKPDESSEKAEEQTERLRKSFEKKLASYQAHIEAREYEIRQCYEELSKFQRVPTSHRASQVVADDTFQQRPEYDEYGESIYGSNPPTDLPKIGNQEYDGWIYTEERLSREGRADTRYWPVYYYKGD